MRRAALAAAAALAALAALAAPAAAAPRLVEIGQFDRPVSVASPPADQRIYVVEQHTGRVEVLDAGGALLEQPFLDVGGEIATGGEQGLLSIAFPPDHAQSGRFYVFLTARTTGQVQVREYRRSVADPERADPATMRMVLTQDHATAANHNGGGMLFGPDGALWVSIGDGGGANDPENDAQQPQANLLGKLLRVDPLTGAGAAGNPFGDRVFHYGLRNPWRFSFDRQTGDLLIADVGQSAREEVDLAPAAEGRLPGANWGWRCWEGSIRTPGVTPACEAPGHRPPIHETSHDGDGACSITGGFVVRDPGLPTLAGRYLYGDVCWSELRSVALGAGDDRVESGLGLGQVVSFAEDACGRLLVASLDGGVHRIVDGEPSPCPPPSSPDPAPPPAAPAPGAQPPACGLSARAFRTRRRAHVLRRGLAVRVGVRARCEVDATGRMRRAGRFDGRPRTLVAGERATLRMWPNRRARRLLRRRRAVTVRIRIRALAPDGRGEHRTVRTRVRR